MSRPLRILLIEDTERDAALLGLFIRRAGYQPTLVRIETGEEMAARLESEEWDVVISDVNLPRFGASAALTILKESGRQFPFLVLSGESDEELARRLVEAGAIGCLVKDQMPKVIEAIDRIMQAKS